MRDGTNELSTNDMESLEKLKHFAAKRMQKRMLQLKIL